MNGQDDTGPNAAPNAGQHAAMTATEFVDMVAAFGADTKRWPAPKRAAAERLVSGDPIVRISLSEAGALDRILAAAPVMSATRDAVLAERIMQAAQQAPRLIVQNGALAPSVRAVEKPHQLSARAPVRGAAWQGAALLAASLLVGVFVGQTEFSGGALPALVELAGLDTGLDAGHVDHSDED